MAKIEIDVSDKVLCDDCDKLFTADSPETGGILFQSKALCPTCAPKWEASAAKYGEEHLIRGRAAVGETFFAATMRWRAGNNTVVLTGSQDFVDDMQEAYRARLTQ